ncbi:expressed unknown protein [Seminavis robusta]|uniref:Uncharacterized protein n=1 Tax=Seminavis robusta TaxID=568900 RepID=A0A9N8HJS0_9STRA|nr:expressed unknown protein [Seminavis robusta]|eukprot:Sro880_g215170.1 n/a (106) ;mRNA; r:43494-43811
MDGGRTRTFGGTTTTLAAKVAEQAGMIVKQMEVDPFVVPDTSVYNFLMDACLSDGSMVGVTRAEQTLTKMMENPLPMTIMAQMGDPMPTLSDRGSHLIPPKQSNG